MKTASTIVSANAGFELLEACTNAHTGEIFLRRTPIIAWRLEEDTVVPETQIPITADYLGAMELNEWLIFAIKYPSGEVRDFWQQDYPSENDWLGWLKQEAAERVFQTASARRDH